MLKNSYNILMINCQQTSSHLRTPNTSNISQRIKKTNNGKLRRQISNATVADS